MKEEKIDVLGIGNAMVDILAHVDDDFLAANGVEKDIMNLVSDEKSNEIYGNLKKVEKEISGGSVANTIYGLGKMGIKTGYIGKISNDRLGKVFAEDIRKAGVEYDTRPLSEERGIATSRCIILVTPDATRSMNTYLGASGYITPFDVDETMIRRADITYLEGYLFDKEEAKKAFKLAADIAHRAGKKIALSLSDPFCVNRHHDEFVSLIEEYVDILFCNEDEIKALCGAKCFPDKVPNCKLVVITRGKEGAVIISNKEYIEVPPEKKAKVVDLTGAGDAFAAGFLYGYVKGLPLKTCGEIATVAATEIISHIGARAQKDVLELLKKKDLI